MTLLRQMFGMAIAIAGLLFASLAAAQPITFTKDTSLRSEPRFDASPSGQVRSGATGESTAKQGPWLNIKTPQAAGWALTTDVSFASGGGSSTIAFSAKPQRVGGTGTLGARGFDKETIGTALGESAPVSTAQLALLDGYAASKDDGQSFASGKGLSASSVAY